MNNTIINTDALNGLRQLPENSIDCCVTSPPYWGLRDYGVPGQLGLEDTPEEFVDKLVDIFKEVRRVLKPEGTLWLNLGDTYCSTAPGSMGDPLHIKESSDELKKSRQRYRPHTPKGMKPKDLVGIPWMVAFALRSSGWYLRQDIIWSKPNPMPESVVDRCTKAHEYIFLLSKSRKYYYDHESIKVDSKRPGELQEIGFLKDKELDKSDPNYRTRGQQGNVVETKSKANKRSVWTVGNQPLKEAHFAAFPEKLIIDCIKAGCPEDGVVLDPFMGAGTTALVARKLNRKYLGIEINPEYIGIAESRLKKELGLFQ